MKGNLATEVLLWVFFFWLWFIPGIIYSIWRLTTATKGCPKCKHEMLSTYTPKGAELFEKYAKNK